MSKGASGLFYGTLGSNPNPKFNNDVYVAITKALMHLSVQAWARQKYSELTGKTKKNFNTACIAFDQKTGKYYYGRNAGYREEGYVRNPILFGDSTHKGILPKQSLNKYPIGNCAEVDAINHALNDGAELKNLHITTIHTSKKQFGEYKKSCENCTYAFHGRILNNYSGWINGGN